jgi:RimJ/RimL family protein N-acetyltransferase
VGRAENRGEIMKTDTNALGQPVGFAVPQWKPPVPPTRAALEGRYCRLESLTPDAHAADLHAANTLDSDGRMWTYLSCGPFENAGTYRKWLDGVCSGNDPLFFAIIDSASGKAVGVASYMRIEPASGVIEVGHLAFSPRLQRTRAATEAMYLMMRNAFEMGYRRYEWKCHSLNGPSRAAAERLGFSFEGIFRQHVIHKGRNRDTAWYAIVDHEWPALENAFRRWLDPDNFDADGKQRARLSDLTREALAL